LHIGNIHVKTRKTIGERVTGRLMAVPTSYEAYEAVELDIPNSGTLIRTPGETKQPKIVVDLDLDFDHETVVTIQYYRFWEALVNLGAL